MHRFITAAILFTVTTSHAAPITASALGLTRDLAVQAALRAAVEQGTGVALGSQTLIKNYQTVSDHILTKSAGYISGYEVIADSVSFGLRAVTVRAEVSQGALERDLAAQKILVESAGNPRLIVLLDEYNEGAPSLEKTAAQVVAEILVKKGFTVLDEKQYQANAAAITSSSADPKALATAGFRSGADLVVRGTVSAAKATPTQIYGRQFYSVPIQFNARVVRTDNAQEIASVTQTVRKNSQTEFSAAQFGLTKGGEAVAEALIAQLLAYWQSTAFNENTIELAVTGCTAQNLRQVTDSLARIEGVRSTRLRFLEGTTALYDIAMAGSAQTLRAGIEKHLPKAALTLVTGARLGIDLGGKSTAVSYEYTPPAFEITGLSFADIFPSRLGSYARDTLATLTLTSSAPVDNVRISVSEPALFPAPAGRTVSKLPAGSTALGVAAVPASAPCMAATTPKTLYGSVSVSAKTGGREITRILTAPLLLQDRGAMDWNVPEALAGFVTPRDPAVLTFARGAVRQLPTGADRLESLAEGLAVFESMRAAGFRYVKDPAAVPGALVLDRVQFPAESFTTLTGDCDDLTVLYAALLSSLGIDCAALVYRDHVQPLFSTGLPAKNRTVVSADTAQTVIWRDEVWIPVEATALGESFADAWRTAAAEYGNALAAGTPVTVVDFVQAWNRYPAVDPGIPARETRVADTATVAASLRALDAVQATVRSAVLEKLATQGTPAARRTAAMLLVRDGRYSDAARAFESLAATGDFHDASDAASALLLAGDVEEASARLDGLFTKEKNPRVGVNRALARYARAVDAAGMDEFVETLREAAAAGAHGTSLLKLLGLPDETAAGVRAAGPAAVKPQTVDRRKLQELIRARVLSQQPTASGGSNAVIMTAFGGIRGADPLQTAKLADLLCFFAEERAP